MPVLAHRDELTRQLLYKWRSSVESDINTSKRVVTGSSSDRGDLIKDVLDLSKNNPLVWAEPVPERVLLLVVQCEDLGFKI